MSETAWVETRTEIDTVSWDNKPVHLTDVAAIKNPKTGKIWVNPSDVSRAELAELARLNGIEPRDIPILLTLKAQAGGFLNKEEVQFQYHINKILFYQWKNMEKIGLGETFTHDQFVKARRGPVPENINEDIRRLSDMGLISVKLHRWGKGSKAASKQITLTEKGSQLTAMLLDKIPTPLLNTTAEVKTRLYPITPSSVKDLVHKEYPEYRKTYTVKDTD